VRTTRGVALITQSSNIALNLTMQARGLPLAYVMTVGNQAQTSMAEVAETLLEDERVTALGLHIEGIGDVRAFERMAARARELGKRIVAVKAGASEQARMAALSHTGALAGSDAGARALLDRLGVARVETLSQMLETLKSCT
jgi:acyl-CoA synthetase (NDP forming)